MQLQTNPDGSVTEIPPTHCPNGHPLKYPNVIVANWPKPGAGKHRARGTAWPARPPSTTTDAAAQHEAGRWPSDSTRWPHGLRMLPV